MPTDAPRMIANRVGDQRGRVGAGEQPHVGGHQLATRFIGKQRRELLDERFVERLLERRFVDDRGGAGGSDDFGIGQLIGLDVARIGHEHGRHAGERKLGQRRAAGAADDQIAGEHHGRHFVDERHRERIDADCAIAIDRLLKLAFARLMDDLPAAGVDRPAARSARGMNSLMDRAAVGAADHDQPPLASSREPAAGRREQALAVACFGSCSLLRASRSRYIRSNAGRAGLPVTTSGVFGRKVGPHVVEAGSRPRRPSGRASV